MPEFTNLGMRNAYRRVDELSELDLRTLVRGLVISAYEKRANMEELGDHLLGHLDNFNLLPTEESDDDGQDQSPPPAGQGG